MRETIGKRIDDRKSGRHEKKAWHRFWTTTEDWSRPLRTMPSFRIFTEFCLNRRVRRFRDFLRLTTSFCRLSCVIWDFRSEHTETAVFEPAKNSHPKIYGGRSSRVCRISLNFIEFGSCYGHASVERGRKTSWYAFQRKALERAAEETAKIEIRPISHFDRYERTPRFIIF